MHPRNELTIAQCEFKEFKDILLVHFINEILQTHSNKQRIGMVLSKILGYNLNYKHKM